MGDYSMAGYSRTFFKVNPTIIWYPFIPLGGRDTGRVYCLA